jgi:uncharacterized membrane protein
MVPRPGLVLGMALEELSAIHEKVLSSAWQALFGDPVRAFGVVSLILLLALAIAPAKEHFSQWHSYQRQYLR